MATGMNRGLSSDQTHRVLEDFQRISMVFGILELQQTLCKNSTCAALIKLAREEVDAIHRDIKGMMNGNEGSKNGGSVLNQKAA